MAQEWEWGGGRTPLMCAAITGATAALAGLVKLRANLDAQCNYYG